LDIAMLQSEEASHTQTRHMEWSDKAEAETAGPQAAAEASEHRGIAGTNAFSDQPRSFKFGERSRFDLSQILQAFSNVWIEASTLFPELKERRGTALFASGVLCNFMK
jgi:hypothetical protein